MPNIITNSPKHTAMFNRVIALAEKHGVRNTDMARVMAGSRKGDKHRCEMTISNWRRYGPPSRWYLQTIGRLNRLLDYLEDLDSRSAAPVKQKPPPNKPNGQAGQPTVGQLPRHGTMSANPPNPPHIHGVALASVLRAKRAKLAEQIEPLQRRMDAIDVLLGEWSEK